MPEATLRGHRVVGRPDQNKFDDAGVVSHRCHVFGAGGGGVFTQQPDCRKKIPCSAPPSPRCLPSSFLGCVFFMFVLPLFEFEICVRSLLLVLDQLSFVFRDIGALRITLPENSAHSTPPKKWEKNLGDKKTRRHRNKPALPTPEAPSVDIARRELCVLVASADTPACWNPLIFFTLLAVVTAASAVDTVRVISGASVWLSLPVFHRSA